MKRLLSILILLCTGVLTALAADLPFKTTSISGGQFAVGTEWYAIQLGDYYLYYDNGQIKCSETADVNDDAYFWCFEGNNKKFHIYNKKKGTSGALGHEGIFEANTTNSCTFTSSGNYMYYKEGRGIYAKDFLFQQYLTTANGRLVFLMDAQYGTRPTIKSLSEIQKQKEEQRAAAERVAREIEAEKAAAQAAEMKKIDEADPIPFQLSRLNAEGNGFEGEVTYYYIYEGEKYLYATPERVSYMEFFRTLNDQYLWAFVQSKEHAKAFYVFNKKGVESGLLKLSEYKDLYYMKDGKIQVLDHEQFRRYNSITEFPDLTFEKFDQAKFDKERKEQEAAWEKEEAAKKAKKNADYKAMIAKVGQANYNKLMNNQMPTGITLTQLDTYASYIHKYYENTEHDIRFRQISSSIWVVTLAKTNGAANYEDRYVYFNSYRIYLTNGRVTNYVVVRN